MCIECSPKSKYLDCSRMLVTPAKCFASVQPNYFVYNYGTYSIILGDPVSDIQKLVLKVKTCCKMAGFFN